MQEPQMRLSNTGIVPDHPKVLDQGRNIKSN